MFSTIESLKGFFKRNQVMIDNKIFRLHYRVTAVALVACSLVVSTKQFIGDPINCFTTHKDDVPKDVLNAYCWIHSTYTIPSIQNDVNKNVLSPGVGRHEHGEEIKYHKYYQWVGLCLLLQAITFYAPHYIWTIMEKRKLKMLRLNLEQPLNPENTLARETLEKYIFDTRGNHNSYAYKYFACELLNVVVAIGQIFLTNYFLENEFLEFGPKVLAFSEMDQEERTDPMVRVFPRVTKCKFQKYGPSGELNNYSALCVLPLNVVNEKIYIILWFWFVVLAVLSAIVCLYRILLLKSVKIRKFTLGRVAISIADKIKLSAIVEAGKIGDWLLLKRIADNIDLVHFIPLVQNLYSKLREVGEIKGRDEEKALNYKKKSGDLLTTFHSKLPLARQRKSIF